jgi:hypothetical protein
LAVVCNIIKHHSEIIRPLTGQVVCEAARFDKSRILFHSETVGLAHDNIEEVGIQRLVNGKQDDELFWYKRNKDNTGWDITTLPLTQHCIDTSLPALFRQSHNPEFNSTPHLCSDGSIIFRYAFHIGRTGGEELVLSTLLRQKPEGPISVLTWEAWYTCSAAGPYESAPTPSVLRRTWYPDESGKIISAYPRTTFSPNELLFDIDTTNDYLIFLRGGRLWKLNLDK